jgi:diguanylate cyclase (GGDEF)-like protein
MSTNSTLTFGINGPALFRPEEVRELMEVEFDRAERHGHPLTCLLIQVDELTAIQTAHGHESKEEVLRSLATLLKRETRAGDCLATTIDERVLVLLPHTSGEMAAVLAKRLLRTAREMRFDLGGRTLRVTLSIGLAQNQRGEATSLETLLRVAEEGVRVAEAAGGDRFVETELYQLFERGRKKSGPRAASEKTVRGLHALPPTTAPARLEETSILALARGPRDEEYRKRLEELIALEGTLEGAVARMAEEIFQKDARDHAFEKDRLAAREGEYKREIDLLERRLAKLARSLGTTEDALRKMSQLKAVDHGVASVFREVQGLSGEDPHSNIKRELMASIFQANLALQKDPSGGERKRA